MASTAFALIGIVCGIAVGLTNLATSIWRFTISYLRFIAYALCCYTPVFLFYSKNNKQKYIVDYTLDELEQSLDPQQFYRANRQHILSYRIITTVHPWFNGKLKVDISLPESEPIIVSREKAHLLKEWLGG